MNIRRIGIMEKGDKECEVKLGRKWTKVRAKIVSDDTDGLTTLSSVWIVAEMACICVLLSLGSCELNTTKFNLGVLCWTLSLTVSQSLVFAACRSGGASFLTVSGTVSDRTLP